MNDAIERRRILVSSRTSTEEILIEFSLEASQRGD